MNSGEARERIEIGSDVLGSDGEKLGSVEYVVVHPPELHVTDIVVSTGAILGRDVLVPVEMVDRIAGGKVHLSIDKHGMGGLKDYVEVHYTQPPEGWIPTSGFTYPAQATLWPADMYYPQISDVTVNAPSGTVGVHEGMEVESCDGHRVGSIAALDADPSSHDVTGIVIRQGVLFRHDARIPMEDISDVTNDRVILRLTRDEVHRRVEAGRD